MSKTLKTNLKGDESMTTCVNQEKKGYAGKAVSATLAGVLAVGMVPAAAFAEAVPQGEDASLELLADDSVTATADFNLGTVKTAHDNVNNDEISDLTSISYGVNTAGKAANYPVIDKVTGGSGVEYTLSTSSTSGTSIQAYTAYFKQVTAATSGAVKIYVGGEEVYVNSSSETDAADINAGTYYALALQGQSQETLTADNSYAGVKFTVAKDSLDGATIYEVNSKDAEDTSDTTYTYTGSALSLGVVLNGEIVDSNKYELQFVQDGAFVVDQSSTKVNPTNAGTYTAYIVGKANTNYDGSVVEIKNFVVNKLDLSTATIEASDVKISDSKAAPSYTINSLEAPSEVKATLTNSPGKSMIDEGDAGVYEYTLAPTEESKNVTGSANISYSAYKADAAFFFDGGATSVSDLSTGDSATTIDLSEATPSWSLDKIVVKKEIQATNLSLLMVTIL
jgi:hypothetical protein